MPLSVEAGPGIKLCARQPRMTSTIRHHGTIRQGHPEP